MRLNEPLAWLGQGALGSYECNGIFMYMSVYRYRYACVYVCMFACACACVCMLVRVYLCVRACARARVCVRVCVRRCSGYGPDGTATKVDPLRGPFDVYYTAAPTQPPPPSRAPTTARQVDVAVAFLSSSSSSAKLRGCAGAVNAISVAISAVLLVAALHLRE